MTTAPVSDLVFEMHRERYERVVWGTPSPFGHRSLSTVDPVAINRPINERPSDSC